jgi:hypothetical protein
MDSTGERGVHSVHCVLKFLVCVLWADALAAGDSERERERKLAEHLAKGVFLPSRARCRGARDAFGGCGGCGGCGGKHGGGGGGEGGGGVYPCLFGPLMVIQMQFSPAPMNPVLTPPHLLTAVRRSWEQVSALSASERSAWAESRTRA